MVNELTQHTRPRVISFVVCRCMPVPLRQPVRAPSPAVDVGSRWPVAHRIRRSLGWDRKRNRSYRRCCGRGQWNRHEELRHI